nr:MAG TPA: hypothetical protein [Caudoviricetes sp.]
MPRNFFSFPHCFLLSVNINVLIYQSQLNTLYISIKTRLYLHPFLDAHRFGRSETLPYSLTG